MHGAARPDLDEQQSSGWLGGAYARWGVGEHTDYGDSDHPVAGRGRGVAGKGPVALDRCASH